MPDDTKEAILSLVNAALFGIPLALYENVDRAALCRESVAQCVTALAYEAAKKALNKAGQTLPPDVDAEWQNAVNAVFRRNIRVEAEHAELHKLFSGSSGCHPERSEGSPELPDNDKRDPSASLGMTVLCLSTDKAAYQQMKLFCKK